MTNEHRNYLPEEFFPGPPAPSALLPPDRATLRDDATYAGNAKRQTRSACDCNSSTWLCKTAAAASRPAECDKALHSQRMPRNVRDPQLCLQGLCGLCRDDAVAHLLLLLCLQQHVLRLPVITPSCCALCQCVAHWQHEARRRHSTAISAASSAGTVLTGRPAGPLVRAAAVAANRRWMPP